MIIHHDIAIEVGLNPYLTVVYYYRGLAYERLGNNEHAIFIEMAGYLLSEGYKDAAAVMIGSVLEEHLRQLCKKPSISIEIIKNGKKEPKSADTLNSELAGKSVYNRLDQKQVTTWLDLRNNAAHGRYTAYTKEQVELMHQGVINFISRNAL